MKTNTNIFTLILCMLPTCCALSAWGVEPAKPNDFSSLVGKLQERIDRQDRRISDLEAKLKGKGLDEARKQEIRKIVERISAERKITEFPAWIEGIGFFGDLRLRYEGTCTNTRAKRRHRGRFRLRAGVKKTWMDKQMEAVFRLASGSSNGATSTNQTFDDSASEKDVWIDLAYARYAPKSMAGLAVTGGKMKKPFVYTDMLWDSDVNPEGVWGEYRLKGLGPVEPFVGAGLFVLNENADDHDARLAAYEVGWRCKAHKDVSITSAATFYDFQHYEDNYANAGGNTTAGGRLTAEEFDVLNVTNKVDFKLLGQAMCLWADYAHNCGNKMTSKRNAFAAGCKVGTNKKKGDWSSAYKYAYIEADSVPGGFNDGTFGGSNRKGHVVSGKYNITDYLAAGVSVFYTQSVSGAATGDTNTTIQGDLIWKF